MREDPISAVLRQFRRVEGLRFAGALSDAELLDRFLARRDEAAFEVLVWRHGPMVLRVCHRVLRQTQDAEDAFQATFLVLFRKAGSIGRRASLGAWLHRVACRTAWRLRKKNAPFVTRREPLTDVPAPPAAPENEIALWLDDAVNRLPERYRTAFILCCLQDRTYEQAAAELGCPLGTVQSRLARARQRLQQWLTQRGLTVGGAALSLSLADAAGAVEITAPLVQQTLSLAAQLAAGTLTAPPVAAVLAGEVLRSLVVARVWAAAFIFLAVTAVLGGWAWQTGRAPPHNPPPANPPTRAVQRPPDAPPKRPALKLPELQGDWGLDTVDGRNDRPAMGERRTVLMTLKDKHCTLKVMDALEVEGTLAGNPGADPPSFLLTIKAVRGDLKGAARAGRFGELLAARAPGDILAGVYRRSGNSALLTLAAPGRPAPASFPARADPNVLLLRGFVSHRVLVIPY
jgi:RNA polymerase sigma factor (sigma-70 family)